ncbi:hypothetical protein EVG20_g1542 [Dentipellis fragilis]|uniref:Uncharacterized protein n=1 Tax=Dentipellis fragilis TaxID=205917 RepID=A0A4Y9Z9M3_9AGAM|nr:hypothetical protein EVG20_g1542 [Dentipellis fragilis]
MGIPLDRAVLVALFVESITYGICITISIVTTLVLMRAKAEGGVADFRLLGALLFMLVTATVHVVLSLIRVFDAFLLSSDVTPVEYLTDPSNPVFRGKIAVLVLQSLLGDGVNIWRCFVVYNRKLKAVAIPSAITLAGIVSGCFVLTTLSRTHGSWPSFNNLSRWITAYDTLMMSTNIYCTVAIAFKIYTTGSHRTNLGSLLPVFVAIIETGALYTASLMAYLIAYLAASYGQYIVLDIVTPLVPCLFCLLILQVKFHNAGPQVINVDTISRQSKEHSRISFGDVRRTLKRSRTPNSIGVTTFQMQSVAIEVSTEAEEHYPGEDHPRTQKKNPSDVDFRDV